MKIQFIQISNILSFQYFDNIDDAERLIFDSGLNILIGENGSGKSTALEVINFLFRRVLFKKYAFNQESYSNRASIISHERKNILQQITSDHFSGFRLEPNWDNESKLQKIRFEVKLDDIDSKNIKLINDNFDKIQNAIEPYSVEKFTPTYTFQEIYNLEITLDTNNKTFTYELKDCNHDFGFDYLTHYNFFKEAIAIFNLENPTTPINSLYDSFTLINCYRNYHRFNTSISLVDQHPGQQMMHIYDQDYAKSLNTGDHAEPSIFGIVRLRVADKHFNLMSQNFNEQECEHQANLLPFMVSINEKLKVINIECKIKLLDQRTWRYKFDFFDIRRKKSIGDINNLSAGQKSIIHLIFEAYGRGDLKGGLILIDEPELHLHYQFQTLYVQLIKQLNDEQSCQYILATHSEALINSTTINYVKRFSLNHFGNTIIKSPKLTAEQKILIKILDNTRTTFAFFAKKVLLVEGDTDRYFFKSILQEIYPNLIQEIAILFIGGKGGYKDWSQLFLLFGLEVFFISDFDFIIERTHLAKKGTPLKTSSQVSAFKKINTNWEALIEEEYFNNIFILKNGDLESYLSMRKKADLTDIINFCNNNLTNYLAQDPLSNEIKRIIQRIIS